MTDLDLAAVEARIRQEIMPRLDIDDMEGGYNCCGCSTYDWIVEDCLHVIRGEPLPDRREWWKKPPPPKGGSGVSEGPPGVR